jgi:hypothetical protein
MEVLGVSENPRGVKIRYKLVQSSVTTTTPVSLPPAVPQPSFGPVIEQVIYNVASGRPDCIDFDEGKTGDLPNNLESNYASKYEWMEKQGFDALAWKGEGLECPGMTEADATLADWDGMAATAVANQLEKADKLEAPALQTWGKLPTTWVFHTREGASGLLQITGFTDNPRGVKIRYKLVETGSAMSSRTGEPAKVRLTNATDAVQFRWVAGSGQTDLSAELFADTRDLNSTKQLAVLREVLLDATDVESSGFTAYGRNGRELMVFFKPNSRYKLYGATELNKRRQLALIWKGKLVGVVEIKSGVFNGLKIPLGAGVSEQDGLELQNALGHAGPATK